MNILKINPGKEYNLMYTIADMLYCVHGKDGYVGRSCIYIRFERPDIMSPLGDTISVSIHTDSQICFVDSGIFSSVISAHLYKYKTLKI